MPAEGVPVSDQVAAILRAAEETAERIREEAEARLRARIAEADRAAEHRVKAAEEEAAEVIRGARVDAESIRKDAVALAQTEADRVRMEADALKHDATGEALAIVARAQENADATMREASARVRTMLSEARAICGEVQADGQLLAVHVRELGDSMRANAERLLRDIQAVHSTFLAQIEKIDPAQLPAAGTGGFGSAPRPAARGSAPPPDRQRGSGGAIDDLEVPEFIPRS